MARNIRSADGADADHEAAASMRFGRAPGAWPFLGHVVALQRRPLSLLDSLPAHGDLVEVMLGPRPAFVVCHPDKARQVQTDFRGFDRTGLVYDRVRMAMGNGLATVRQQDHRRQRLIMQLLASITACWNLPPEPGTRVSPAARAVLVPRSFPVRLSHRVPASR